MLEWISENGNALLLSAVIAVVMFVGALVATGVFIARMPEDYFVRRHGEGWPTQHPAVRLTLIIAKNLLGALLVLAGFAMIFLPGQGLLTILIGVMLLDFPGKRRLEVWMISRRPIHRATTWIRRKQGRPPLRLPDGVALHGPRG